MYKKIFSFKWILNHIKYIFTRIIVWITRKIVKKTWNSAHWPSPPLFHHDDEYWKLIWQIEIDDNEVIEINDVEVIEIGDDEVMEIDDEVMEIDNDKEIEIDDDKVLSMKMMMVMIDMKDDNGGMRNYNKTKWWWLWMDVMDRLNWWWWWKQKQNERNNDDRMIIVEDDNKTNKI